MTSHCTLRPAMPSLIGDADHARTVAEQFVELSDVIKASDEDLNWLYPTRSASDVAQGWLSRGAALVIVTRGESGPYALARSGVVELPAKETTVEDTVGAGDSFMAATLALLDQHALLGPANWADLYGLTPTDMSSLLSYANEAAAITCSRRGANPPTLEELRLATSSAPATGSPT